MGTLHVGSSMMTPTEHELSGYKKFSIKAAKDLGYPKTVEKKIKKAKSTNEIALIMNSARKEYWHKLNEDY